MKKTFDRFNGVTEEELYQRSLDDRIDYNLDIVFVNISPGLYSVYKQSHYAGPGNHFWRCIYESGLTNRIYKSSEDTMILTHRMGLINMLQKPNVSCQDLSAAEMQEARDNLNKCIRQYNPKIVAFNGKSIYEIYTGGSVDREFNFGKQPVKFENTASHIFVLPSSSARCSQLPKVIDKVPFYAALKKFRDHLNGQLSYVLSDLDIMFPDFKVALEVNKEETNKSIEGNEASEPEENSFLDEHTHENSAAAAAHKIKFVRLNNIPFSQLPSEILQTIKIQRQHKKNVTIISSTKDFFKGNIAKQAVTQAAAKKSICSSSITTGTSSDFDTSSDSDSLSAMPSQAQQTSSKLSSLILNVCNSANNGTPPANNETTSKPIQLNAIKLPVQISQSKPAVLTIPSNTVKHMTNSNSTIKQILAAPLRIQPNTSPHINKLPVRVNTPILSAAAAAAPIQQLKVNLIPSNVVQTDSYKPVPVETVQQNKPVQQMQIISLNNPNVQQVEVFNENAPLGVYELELQDRYHPTDFYTFAENPTFARNDLNNIVQLYYKDDVRKHVNTGVKRHFSNLNEATANILNNQQLKRRCKINLLKL